MPFKSSAQKAALKAAQRKAKLKARPKPKPKPKVKVWTTQDGRQIPIDKLEDYHLQNILILLRRRHLAMKTFIMSLSDFMLGVPRSVREALQEAAGTIGRYPPHPLYPDLEAESRRRNESSN